MGYIKEFSNRLAERNFPRFLELWEEYLTVDTTDASELIEILKNIKQSDLSIQIGGVIENLLPMWETIQDPAASYEVLRLIFDLETTDSDKLRELATKIVTDKYESSPHYKEGMKLVGLKGGPFQGALRKFDLLAHLEKGKFVYHSSGWGTGVILDISFVREQLTLDFELVNGKKELSFVNAFKTLVPISSDSFLARRFSDADQLEVEARKDPLPVLKLLFKDLGPKTAQDIKEEMMDLIIPEEDLVKWWQGARTRLKKDPLIEVPESAKQPFYIRSKEKSLDEEAKEVLDKRGNIAQFIPTLYSFIRDFPQGLKSANIRAEIESILLEKMRDKTLSPEAELQFALFLEQYLDKQVPGHTIQEGIEKVSDPKKVINAIEVMALKKRALQAVQQGKQNWPELFLELLVEPQSSMLRDYLLKTLLGDSACKEKFLKSLEGIFKKPDQAPDFFAWYFQKIIAQEEVPFGDKEGAQRALESLLILLSSIENQPTQKDLVKKILNLLSGKRYEVVREIIHGASTPYLKEFLLLASKCNSFSEQDVKILTSLAAVVDPGLSEKKAKRERQDANIFWATSESLKRIQERIKLIATSETVDNAREIEAARALGDLRENSEYKFAKERRARLQEEMRRLSQEIQKARVLSQVDVDTDEIGIGNIITLLDSKGQTTTYTILGPWDADAENGILSNQSPFSQAMMGKSVGDTFQFKGEEYKVGEIATIFDRK